MRGRRQPLYEHAAYLVRQSDRSTWRPDAALTIRFDRRWRKTEHPVEGGAAISDHVQSLPDAIVLQCVVTATPTTGSGGRIHLRDRLKWLTDTADAKVLVDVVTRKLGTFTGYVLTSIPHAIDKVDRLRFDLELQELVQATATEVLISVDNVASDVAAGAPDEVDVAEQGTTDTAEDDEQAEEVDASLLYELLYGEPQPEEAA
jgi:hypothetical protein